MSENHSGVLTDFHPIYVGIGKSALTCTCTVASFKPGYKFRQLAHFFLPFWEG